MDIEFLIDRDDGTHYFPRYDMREAHVDQSYVTSPEELALLKQAGADVGMRVAEVAIVLDRGGTQVPIPKGQVGVRYVTGDIRTYGNFIVRLNELRDLEASQATLQQTG